MRIAKIILPFCILFPVLSNAQTKQVTYQMLFDTTSFLPALCQSRIAMFAQEPVVTGKIIFLGNSITQGGD